MPATAGPTRTPFERRHQNGGAGRRSSSLAIGESADRDHNTTHNTTTRKAILPPAIGQVMLIAHFAL